MKQQFSSLDIKAIVPELSDNLLGLRVSNIYDLNPRTILFKFQKPDVKDLFIVETGFRCHTTKFARETASAPSGFVSKLRAFLRTRRLTAASQIGTDRIIELTFSDGLYRLFLEFYAAGNIILTDKDLKIVALQRVVTEGAEHEHVRLGMTYNLSQRQNVEGVPDVTEKRVETGISEYLNKMALSAGAASLKGGKKKKSKDLKLRTALSSFLPEYPPALLEHALHLNKLDGSLPPDQAISQPQLRTDIVEALKTARVVFDQTSALSFSKGYIIAQAPPKESGSEPEAAGAVITRYEEFHPFRPAQFESSEKHTILEFDTFAQALDAFFSTIEEDKIESRLQAKEDAAKVKIDHARQAHENQILDLKQTQELNIRKAQAIELNQQLVEDAVSAVKNLLHSGMDWTNIGKYIELEQQKKNSVAAAIQLPLKLKEKVITLRLREDGAEEQEEESESDWDDSAPEDAPEPLPKAKSQTDAKALTVDIDLTLSIHANMQKYYSQKKVAFAKEKRTVEISTTAMRRQEAKIMADLKQSLIQEKELLRPVRPQYWFEKFYYFFSTDGYLVVGAKDLQQVDLLCSKYLLPGDVFVHADLGGAPPMIIKNRLASPNSVAASGSYPPIPPSTLSQAGSFSVCGSKAWDSKAVMSGWWVPASSVTKIAQLTKDALPVGAYELTGPKTYLPPAQLLLGIAVAFQIDDESKERRASKRTSALASTSSDPSSVSGSDGVASRPVSSGSVEGMGRNSEEDGEGDKDGNTDEDEDGEGEDEREDSDDEESEEDDSDDDFFPDVTLQPSGPKSKPREGLSSVIEAAPKSIAGSEPTVDTDANLENDREPPVLENDEDELDHSSSSHPNTTFDPFSFVGRPSVDETLLAAIPICAPWSALSTYKYKIKIQPGQLKKGKAVRNVLSVWENTFKSPGKVDSKAMDPERAWPEEVKLIRAWKEAEVIGIVPVGKMAVANPKGGTRNAGDWKSGGGGGNYKGGKGKKGGKSGSSSGGSKAKGGKSKGGKKK